MNRFRLPLLAQVLLVVALATACSSPPPVLPDARAPGSQAQLLQASYARMAADGGRVFALEPAASSVRIYVFRDGRAARLGHNHVLNAPRFSGFALLPAAGLADTRFDLEFRLDELAFDDPRQRAGLGAAFASVLSAEAIQGTREHMLGEDNMQAARFPFVRVHGLRVSGEAPHLAALVAVEMHGVTREQWIALTISGLPDALTVSGSFVLRQTDFGIHPYSVAGGLLAVKDEVVVAFDLAGR